MEIPVEFISLHKAIYCNCRIKVFILKIIVQLSDCQRMQFSKLFQILKSPKNIFFLINIPSTPVLKQSVQYI